MKPAKLPLVCLAQAATKTPFHPLQNLLKTCTAGKNPGPIQAVI
jgi:hypothetical protein